MAHKTQPKKRSSRPSSTEFELKKTESSHPHVSDLPVTPTSPGLPSLQLTASLPLKIDGWKMKFPFGEAYFQGAFAVSFREGNLSKMRPIELPQKNSENQLPTANPSVGKLTAHRFLALGQCFTNTLLQDTIDMIKALHFTHHQVMDHALILATDFWCFFVEATNKKTMGWWRLGIRVFLSTSRPSHWLLLHLRGLKMPCDDQFE